MPPDFPGKENIPSYPPYQTEFPMGAWFRYNWTFEEAQYLTWEENCGWFDCNKSAGYVENDGKLCWAASGSTMVSARRSGSATASLYCSSVIYSCCHI